MMFKYETYSSKDVSVENVSAQQTREQKFDMNRNIIFKQVYLTKQYITKHNLAYLFRHGFKQE